MDMTIAADDGSGSFNAYCAMPEGAGDGRKLPGMIVIQEIFGVNANIRMVCDHYAALGYIAVAPDLFWRLEPGLDLDSEDEGQKQKGFSLLPKFDVGKSVEDLIATLHALRLNKGCTGKVGAVGYCLGGRLAYLMATRSSVDASVGYYGVGIQDMLDEKDRIEKPLILHMAGRDGFVPPEAQEKIAAAFRGSDLVTIHKYPDCDHAFARVTGEHYDPEAAQLANGRTEAFFALHLKA